jgi:cyclopropane fatty-acyl-phospholipid synthase-like methyltransferase
MSKRIATGRRADKFDRETEHMAYDSEFYAKCRKDYVDAAPHLKEWFDENLPQRSIIDIGCGTGEMLAHMQDQRSIAGVDFSVGAQETQHLQNFYIRDLTLPIVNVDFKADVVFSLEVYEHIPSEHESTFLDNVTSFNPEFIVMSCAQPGATGRHHYNMLTPKDFTDRVCARGVSHRALHDRHVSTNHEAKVLLQIQHVGLPENP